MWYYCASRTGRCCAHSKVHATASGFVFRSCQLLYCASCRPPLPLYLMSWQLLYSKQGVCHYCASRSGTAVFQTMCLPPFCFKSWQLLYSKPEVATIVHQDLAGVVLQISCLPLLCFKIWQLYSKPGVCHNCASRSGSRCAPDHLFATIVLQDLAVAVHQTRCFPLVLQDLAVALLQSRCLPLLCFKIWQLLYSKPGVCHYCASRSGSCCAPNQEYATTVLQELAATLFIDRCIPL